MQIDEIYINESKRIRKTYLENLSFIIIKEDEIQNHLNDIEKIGEELKKSEDDDETEDYYKDKFSVIDKNVEELKKNIMPYIGNIKKLDKDQRLLYNKIKEKYPDIKDKDIQTQIIPHIALVDNNFKKKNIKLFEKIKNRKNND